MNKRPELKSFVTFGGAESYEGVEVEFIHGRHAYLTIYHDGQKVEKVDLHAIPTETEMHEMMIEKGFTLKSEDEVEKIRREKQPLRLKDEMRRKQREEMRQKYINNKNWQTQPKDEREAGVNHPSDRIHAGDGDGDDEDPDLYGDGLTAEQLADMEREMKRKKWKQVLQERERMEKQKEKEAAATSAADGTNGGGDEL